MCVVSCVLCFFFFNDTATTEIYTLSLHDALPIFRGPLFFVVRRRSRMVAMANEQDKRLITETGVSARVAAIVEPVDRKSTRLNSSHANISYAVFCLKKKHRILKLVGNAVALRLLF